MEVQAVVSVLSSTLAEKRGLTLPQEFIVSDLARGDYEITPTRIVVNPFYITEGDPVKKISALLDLAEEYRMERLLAEKRIIADAKFRLKIALLDLRTFDPENLQHHLEEALKWRSPSELKADAAAESTES